jgi:hypothetical protein
VSPVKHAPRAKIAASKEITNSLGSMSELEGGGKRVKYYVSNSEKPKIDTINHYGSST